MESAKIINPRLVQTARALLGLNANELAALAGVSPATVQRFERGTTAVAAHTVRNIRKALEACGAEFIGGEYSGVRIKTADLNADEE